MLSRVCRTASHLFEYTSTVTALGRGWDRVALGMVESDAGMRGGPRAHDFMAPCPAGEDDVALAQEGENHALIAKLQKSAKFEGALEVITLDGLRVEYPDGFGLARASNTTPVVVLRFEADTPEALARIQASLKQAILAVMPDARIPY